MTLVGMSPAAAYEAARKYNGDRGCKGWRLAYCLSNGKAEDHNQAFLAVVDHLVQEKVSQAKRHLMEAWFPREGQCESVLDGAVIEFKGREAVDGDETDEAIESEILAKEIEDMALTMSEEDDNESHIELQAMQAHAEMQTIDECRTIPPYHFQDEWLGERGKHLLNMLRSLKRKILAGSSSFNEHQYYGRLLGAYNRQALSEVESKDNVNRQIIDLLNKVEGDEESDRNALATASRYTADGREAGDSK